MTVVLFLMENLNSIDKSRKNEVISEYLLIVGCRIVHCLQKKQRHQIESPAEETEAPS